MSTYETTTDRAATIRRTLKANGWSSRDVSVRAEYYSMGSSLHVTIKNPACPLALVETIANAHESIDRDQFGEILSGGNRFVHIGYSSAAQAVLVAQYRDVCAAAAADVDAAPRDTSLFPIGQTGFLMGRGHNGYGYSLWKDGHIQTANTADYLAGVLAVKMQKEGATV